MSKASHAFLSAAAGICIGSYFLVMGQPFKRPVATGPVQIYVNAADCNSASIKAYVADVTTVNQTEIAAGRVKVSCVQPTQIANTP